MTDVAEITKGLMWVLLAASIVGLSEPRGGWSLLGVLAAVALLSLYFVPR